MRHLIVVYILGVARGQVIYLDKLYSNIRSRFPKECRELGFTGQQRIEPTWKNEVRRGLKLAESRKLIKHVGTPKSGEWQRI
jgi:hypothetical protein